MSASVCVWGGGGGLWQGWRWEGDRRRRCSCLTLSFSQVSVSGSVRFGPSPGLQKLKSSQQLGGPHNFHSTGQKTEDSRQGRKTEDRDGDRDGDRRQTETEMGAGAEREGAHSTTLKDFVLSIFK